MPADLDIHASRGAPSYHAGAPLMALALALAIAPCPARSEGAPLSQAAAVPLVTVVEAAWREIVETTVVTGTLVPREEVLVTPEIDGYRITEVLVEEGARVERGQVLARLSRDLIEHQIAQQAAAVAKAEVAIPQAQSNIDEAEAARTEARLAYDRARQLLQSGNTTAVVMEGRTTARRQTESRLSHARKGLAAAEAELAQARAMLGELELRRARTEIRAPEAGIVSRRTARVGMTVSAASEPLFRLIAHGEIELEGEVIETVLPRLREGSPAFITIGGERIAGSVRAVYPEVDRATRLGKVRIKLRPDPRLRIGTFASGGVELARTEGVSVPLASIRYGAAGRSTVLVVANGVVEMRDVGTGLMDEHAVEIRNGIEAGEQVVLKAGSFLQSGDRVRPAQTERAMPAAIAPSASHRQAAGQTP